MTEVVPHTGEVASLGVARAKLAQAIEIFAPLGVTRENALNMIGLGLIEYEAAVREDERAKLGDAVATAQAAALDATAQAHGDRVRAEAAAQTRVAEGQEAVVVVPEPSPSEPAAAPSAPPPVEPTAPVEPGIAPTGRKSKK